MDVAYDHIQEEELAPDSEGGAAEGREQPRNLNAEFQQAFKAVSSSPWGSKLGGWIGEVRKQGESFYQDLQKEASEASEQATKGLSSLREQVVSRTRTLSSNTGPAPEPRFPGEEGVPNATATAASAAQAEAIATEESAAGAAGSQSLPADIVKEAGTLVASLRLTAAAKLKDLQRAEDAADEALLRFGSNLRNFLRDAVVISAPGDADFEGLGSEVLFETHEPHTGKKVFHTTRLDAQLHAIHVNASSFMDEPQGAEWDEWQKTFDIDKQTEAIAADLDKHEELRRSMEKLVPEKVEYTLFWRRYYFLRKAVEEEERRRKEVLKGAAAETEEEVAWDDDEDEEESSSANPIAKHASESTTTLHATAASDRLTPKPRRSEDENKSVADSDASYDIVSGATSRAAGSPRDEKKDTGKDDSDEDWE